ncbi:hypothetical protein [Nocardiopsis coralliicola]
MLNEQRTPAAAPAPAAEDRGSPRPVQGSGSRPRPRAVLVAAALWAAALGAGALETALGAVQELTAPTGMPAPALAAAIALRAAVTAAFGAVAVLLWRGRRWARPVLALSLGVVGLATLVGAPLAEIVSGAGPAQAFGVGETPPGFLAVRVIHIAAVLGATGAMYAPSAGRYLAQRR